VNTIRLAAAVALMTLPGLAMGVDDRFAKDRPGSMSGFLVVTNDEYRKECGACHLAYSPGLLPARAWQRVMDGLDKHFGESVALRPDARAAITKYLADNAMDTSPYEGSKVLLQKIPDGYTPSRIMLMPYLAYVHTAIREGIAKNGNIQVKRFANCSQCHTEADSGSFAISELFIPGLTRRPHP
jgi:hypothetical protein